MNRCIGSSVDGAILAFDAFGISALGRLGHLAFKAKQVKIMS